MERRNTHQFVLQGDEVLIQARPFRLDEYPERYMEEFRIEFNAFIAYEIKANSANPVSAEMIFEDYFDQEIVAMVAELGGRR